MPAVLSRRAQDGWRRIVTSRRARIAAMAALAIALVAAAVVVGSALDHGQVTREPNPLVAGEKAATHLLELPVPLHEAAREALLATQEAGAALAANDGPRLSAARSRLQRARMAITAFESDRFVSPEQRRTISELNRQLQRVILAVDRAL